MARNGMEDGAEVEPQGGRCASMCVGQHCTRSEGPGFDAGNGDVGVILQQVGSKRERRGKDRGGEVTRSRSCWLVLRTVSERGRRSEPYKPSTAVSTHHGTAEYGTRTITAVQPLCTVTVRSLNVSVLLGWLVSLLTSPFLRRIWLIIAIAGVLYSVTPWRQCRV